MSVSGVLNMKEKKSKLPQEVKKISISKSALKEIVEDKFEEQSDSIEVTGGSVGITLGNSVLRDIFEREYGRRIQSVDIRENEINIEMMSI